ncbi:MAG: alpha/beta fold hydrolase [Bacteroidetes bacterium]|jgi:proline iminopeptidase|nr:alpha/beta fold hydrolase [Bacteroidota bacterium]MBT4410670.1 alpha/beta fold hydrolase [Bacteroidota bacterium]MBT4968653.1 alpha/beta fold hydrolase [Bacteroidota bacterium]MBT7464259.1 alpha/beta fold hydrolase [Bacteroidota bacterium]
MIKKALYILAGFITFVGLLFLHMYIVTEDEYLMYETADLDLSIPSIEIQETILHSETFGEDTSDVVIILHDGPGKDFRLLLPLQRLSNQHFIVFYDQRGSGLSQRVDRKTLNMDQMIEDLHSVIEYYSNTSSVSIIGHSWGGLLATAYASKYPLKVYQLIIIEPWDYSPNTIEKKTIRLSQLSMRYWFESRHVKGPDQQASSDYYFAHVDQMEEIHEGGRPYLETIDSIENIYWRYGSLANKMILENIINEQGNLRLQYFNKIDEFKNDILIMAEAQEMDNSIIQIQLLSACIEQCHFETVQTTIVKDTCEYIKIIQNFLQTKPK